MLWDEMAELVEGLITLNDDNLAQRVLENSDVQNCLGYLYDILHGGTDKGRFE